jgi:hexosaminidase
VTFVQSVLDEVMDVFPGPFVHIGGDEVPRTEWRSSERAQQRKRDLGLVSDDQLYGWFLRRLADHVTAAGRTPVGWDEVREVDDPPRVTVMSWRGDEHGLAAVRAGYDVVMVPEDRMYLDHYQDDPASEPWAPRGLNTMERILDYDPIPADLTGFEARRILGLQGNVWTEYIPAVAHLHYMVFPRACALAEVGWGSPERDSDRFTVRLEEHLRRLDHLGVGYRRPRGSR